MMEILISKNDKVKIASGQNALEEKRTLIFAPEKNALEKKRTLIKEFQTAQNQINLRFGFIKIVLWLGFLFK